MKGDKLINHKYEEIAENIKYKIQKNFYLINSAIPPENTLADEYGVSRITIRNAISKLIDEGYIFSIPGKGNYVLEKNNDKYLISLKTDRLLKKPYQRVELLGSEIIKPTIDLVYHLRIAPDSRVVHIRWILLDEEKPIAYDIQYIPYFPGITVWNDNFEYTSFSEILSQKNKLFQMRGEMNVSGINCEMEIAEILKIPVDTPVMQITQKILDDDEPMGFRQLFIKREWCCIRGTSHQE